MASYALGVAAIVLLGLVALWLKLVFIRRYILSPLLKEEGKPGTKRKFDLEIPKIVKLHYESESGTDAPSEGKTPSATAPRRRSFWKQVSRWLRSRWRDLS